MSSKSELLTLLERLLECVDTDLQWADWKAIKGEAEQGAGGGGGRQNPCEHELSEKRVRNCWQRTSFGKKQPLVAAALPAPVVVGISTVHNWVGGIGNSRQEPVTVCNVAHPGIHIVLHLVPALCPHFSNFRDMQDL